MSDFWVIVISAFVSIFFWFMGYIAIPHTRELSFPTWVKLFYGKPNSQMYVNGTALQTIGYALGLYAFQMGMYLLGKEYVFPPRLLLLILLMFISVPVFIDTIIRELFMKR